MKRFFRSKKFVIMMSVIAVVTALAVTFGCLTGRSAPQTGFTGAFIEPLQSWFSSAADSVSGFFGVFGERDRLEKENAELQDRINELIKEKLEWQESVNENKFYKDFLGLKEEHDDFEFCSARVIARDASDVFGTLTIDCGSIDGISEHDVVITADGLVGYVTTVAPTYSTVTTLLDPSINVGAYDRRTDDSGIVTGSVDLAGKGKCLMTNLNRYSTAVDGDYIVTSGGGGVFPAGLIIGTVTAVGHDESKLTLRAEIEPAADILNCRNVMVITSFTGQGAVDDLIK